SPTLSALSFIPTLVAPYRVKLTSRERGEHRRRVGRKESAEGASFYKAGELVLWGLGVGRGCKKMISSRSEPLSMETLLWLVGNNFTRIYRKRSIPQISFTLLRRLTFRFGRQVFDDLSD